MAEALQSRKRLFTVIVLLIVAVGAFIILRPRLWVKNKTAKVIVDGKLSEDVKLFHGSDDRLLFYLKDDPDGAYYFAAEDGVRRCQSSSFIFAKLLVFSPRRHPYCADFYGSGKRDVQSLEFHRHEKDIVVSWQAAPR